MGVGNSIMNSYSMLQGVGAASNNGLVETCGDGIGRDLRAAAYTCSTYSSDTT